MSRRSAETIWARTRSESATRDIAQAFLDGLNTEQTLNIVLERARDLLAARAAIAIPQPDGIHFTVRVAELNGSAVSPRLRIPMEGSLAADVLRSASPINAGNAPCDLLGADPSSPVAGWGPVLLVPLLQKDRPLGVLELARPVGAPAFIEEDGELVQFFAQQASVAIEYGRRMGARLLIERRLEALVEVTQRILHGGDSKEVLGLVVRRARELIGADAVGIYTPATDGKLLVRQVADGALSDKALRTTVPMAGSLTGWTYTNGRSLNVSDASSDPRAYQPQPTERGPTMFVVFRIGDRPAGVMVVTNQRLGKVFTDDDLSVVEAFAAQVAIWVGYARVREGLQHLGAAGAIEKRSMEETLTVLARAIVDATDSEAAAIFQQQADGYIRTIGSFGLPDGFASGLDAAGRLGWSRPPLEAIRTGRVVTRKVSESIKQLMELPSDPRVEQLIELMKAQSWGTIVAVPLIYQARVVGAVSGYYAEGHEVGATEVAFLKIVADQAASILENARLFALVQEKAALEERQRLARELHDSVSQALYGIALGAQTALDLLKKDPQAVAEPLRYVQRLADAGLAEMRALIFALRPESLEKEGLAAALTKHASALRARYELEVVEQLSAEPTISLHAKQALLRIAQEAMQNVAKHSRATRLEISLASTSSSVVLTITDNGVGFDAAQEFPGHLGLKSMRERTLELDGQIELATAPGKGTRITASVPV